jgi:hypothetical protein
MKYVLKYIGLGLVVSACICATIFAQDAEAIATAEVAKKVEYSVYDMRLDDLQKYQRFVYVPGGRDPFTFRLRTIRKDEMKLQNVQGKGGQGGDSLLKAPDEKEQIKKLKGWMLSARSMLIAGEFKSAQNVCALAVKEVNSWGGTSGITAQNLFERIMNIRETSRRLFNQQEIIAEFESLNIEIGGVRVSEKGTAALINEKIMEPGMTIALENGTTIQIDSIHEKNVIFIYKGQKLSKKVGIKEEE